MAHIKTAKEIDLTPPREILHSEVERYLIENFSRLQQLLDWFVKNNVGNPQLTKELETGGQNILFTEASGVLHGVMFASLGSFNGIRMLGSNDQVSKNLPFELSGNLGLLDTDTLYINFAGAEEGEFLRLGKPVDTTDGRTVHPITSVALDIAPHQQSTTDPADYDLTSGNEVKLNLDIIADKNYKLSTYVEVFVLVEETSSSQATNIKATLKLNNAELSAGGSHTVAVGPNSLHTFAISMTFFAADVPNLNDVLSLHVQALDTGQNRNTSVKGSVQASYLLLNEPNVGGN